jgi:hypothetical protein
MIEFLKRIRLGFSIMLHGAQCLVTRFDLERDVYKDTLDVIITVDVNGSKLNMSCSYPREHVKELIND